jgi:hypothetical protein
MLEIQSRWCDIIYTVWMKWRKQAGAWCLLAHVFNPFHRQTVIEYLSSAVDRLEGPFSALAICKH